MGWGVIDFRYRELYVRLDADRGYATAFLALTSEFSPSWHAHDVLRVVRGGPDPEYMSTERLCEELFHHYNDVVSTLSSERGRDRLAALQSPHFDKWAADSAKEREPARRVELVTLMDEQRRQDAGWLVRVIFRDWWLARAALVGAAVVLWVYVNFLYHPS
jgi:hypothetical protein